MFALYEPTEEHQQELFVDAQQRWPRRPYCSDDLEAGLRIRSLKQALTKPYIQANPPYLRVWSIYDVDKPYCNPDKGEFHSSAVLAWEDANLPPPSWVTVNKVNGHAHLVYGLNAPVLIDGMGARRAPIRLLCSIEAMFRELLQADQGFSGLITKNPVHPLWKTLRGPTLFYELHELAEALPGLEKFRPKNRRVEEVGLGRNVTLFDFLRHWAYRNIRNYKGGGLSAWNAWLSLCNTKALVRNGDFPRPLDGREVWHVARSVAKWTYQHFDIEASDARFSKTQAHRGSLGGKKGGVVRSASYEGLRADARLMAARGISVTDIARVLNVSRPSVYAWLKD